MHLRDGREISGRFLGISAGHVRISLSTDAKIREPVERYDSGVIRRFTLEHRGMRAVDGLVKGMFAGLVVGAMTARLTDDNPGSEWSGFRTMGGGVYGAGIGGIVGMLLAASSGGSESIDCVAIE